MRKAESVNVARHIVIAPTGDVFVNYGWPYCYYDVDRKRLVLTPEYGGDGQRVLPPKSTLSG